MSKTSGSRSSPKAFPSTLNALIDYGSWYYLRYLPSIRKLERKLLQKHPSQEGVNQTIASLEPILIERQLIESKASELYRKGRNEHFIRTSLRSKLFDPKLIEACIISMREENPKRESLSLALRIRRSMHTKSLKRITFDLMASGFDGQEIRAIIEAEGLSDAPATIRDLACKYGHPSKGFNEISRRLASAGFEISDIKDALEDEGNV